MKSKIVKCQINRPGCTHKREFLVIIQKQSDEEFVEMCEHCLGILIKEDNVTITDFDEL